MISWGMVVPLSDTLIIFFFASSMPLRIASGTSPDFTEAEANGTVAVADDNQRRELEDTAALYGFGYAVDGNYALLEIQ